MGNKMLSIGSDWERLVKTPEGEFTSAIGVIGGSKEQPLWVENGNLQEDNVLAEAACNPSNSKEDFISNILSLEKQMSKVLHEHNLIPAKRSHYYYSPKSLYLWGEQALTLGCDPDFCVYTMTQNEIDTTESENGMRSSGGHVHIALENVTDMTRQCTVRVFDRLGVMRQMLNDPDRVRRKLYGKAGSFRPKPYGVECRALSNAWINSEETIGQVYDAAKTSAESGEEIILDIMNIVSDDETQRIINEYDMGAAENAVTAFENRGYI